MIVRGHGNGLGDLHRIEVMLRPALSLPVRLQPGRIRAAIGPECLWEQGAHIVQGRRGGGSPAQKPTTAHEWLHSRMGVFPVRRQTPLMPAGLTAFLGLMTHRIASPEKSCQPSHPVWDMKVRWGSPVPAWRQAYPCRLPPASPYLGRVCARPDADMSGADQPYAVVTQRTGFIIWPSARAARMAN